MATVDGMIQDILRREGGFVTHPLDKGGPTNHGITQATLSRYLGTAATVKQVRELDIDLAAEIYRKEYLAAPRIDTLPERIQPFVFDSAVNHGPGRAIRFVQQVCNAAGFGPIHVDGVAGPETRAAAVAADDAMGDWLLAALVEERRMFYLTIIAADPSQKVFERGWMNRIAEFEDQIEELELA